MKGVILAAGHGTRLLPFTSFRPKHLLPVAGKPILHHSIEYMRDILKIENVILVVGHQRQAIMDYFKNGNDFGIDISYVIQHTSQYHGLAAAVNLVEDKINSDFALLLGDNLFRADLKQVIEYHFETNASATIHIEENENPCRYGVVEIDKDNNVISLEEKPDKPKSNYVISGFYVLTPTIFEMIKGLKPSKRGEYELTDAIQRLVDKKYTVKASQIHGWRIDIGYPEDLLNVNKFYLNEENHRILGTLKDTKIVPPVFIAENCEITSSVIGPYVMIEKGVSIRNSEIKNSVILENSNLEKVFISDSVIGTNSKVAGLKAHSLKVGDYSFISNGTFFR
ncbi:MAG: sugar phosphate nucleotidyltransferase [Candidatus Helarchaeota archaeon]